MATEPKLEPYETTTRKRDFLFAFEKTLGIIQAACQHAGISRPTYYNWRNSDPDFAAKCDKILSEQSSIVEDIFLKKILAEEQWAISLYLTHRHPDYMPKKINQRDPMTETRTLEDLFREAAEAQAAAEVQPPAAAGPQQGPVIDAEAHEVKQPEIKQENDKPIGQQAGNTGPIQNKE